MRRSSSERWWTAAACGSRAFRPTPPTSPTRKPILQAKLRAMPRAGSEARRRSPASGGPLRPGRRSIAGRLGLPAGHRRPRRGGRRHAGEPSHAADSRSANRQPHDPPALGGPTGRRRGTHRDKRRAADRAGAHPISRLVGWTQSLALAVRSWDDDADGLRVQLYAAEVGDVNEFPLGKRFGQGIPQRHPGQPACCPRGGPTRWFAALD